MTTQVIQAHSLPTPSPREQRFWDKIAPSYAKKPVADEQAYQQTLDRVAAHLSARDRVLEIGCGTGTTALHLADRAATIVATDLSDGMIAIARSKAADQGIDNVRFAPATLDDPFLLSESFTKVMAFNLIHLLRDIPAALSRAHDLLEPGGLFISKTPCVGEMGLPVRMVIAVMQLFGKAPHVSYFTKAGLRDAIEQAGFEVMETGLYPAKSHSLFVVARKREG